MRRSLIFLVVLLVLAALWAWPYLGAYQLVAAARDGGSAAVAPRVDFPALRRSLARQIVDAYLRQSGRGEKMGPWQRGLATAFGSTIADPYLEQLIAPQSVATLLSEGRIGTVTVEGRTVTIDRTLPRLHAIFSSDLVHVVFNSYYDGIGSFRFGIPATETGQADAGVELRLHGLTWQLSGIDLPRDVIDPIVADIVAKQKASAGKPS